MSTKEEFRIFAGGLSWDTIELPDAFGRLGKVVEAQALKGSTKLLEQAQLISKTYPNIQNLYSDTNDKATMGDSRDGKDHPQRRRPALGRERAQFSFKPLSSRTAPTVDFSSLDHIADPEEYFLAFEQLQIADKELKRLRGEVATDVTQHQRPTTARERRPGIPGKRCRFSINTDTIETYRVPKEVGPDRRIASPSNTSSVVESSDNLHPEATEQPGISHATGINSKLFDATESEGSVVLLEKLLSAFKNLDGDDAEALLRKSLHIKSMDVDRTRLTDVDNGVANKLDGPQLPHMPPPIHIGGPRTLISTLQRRISMINPLEDIPMPPIDDDDASTPVTVYVERSTFKDKIHSPVLEADKTIRNKITSEEELAEPCSRENRTHPNFSKFDNDGHDAFFGFDGLIEEGNDKQSDALIFAPPDPEVEDLSTGYMNQNNKEILVSSTISSSGSFGLHAILQVEGNVVAEGEPVSGAEVSKDDSSPPRIVLPADGHLESLCILPQENDELQTQGLQEGSGASPNKGEKQGAPQKGQNKKNPTSKKQKLTSELRTQELPEASGVSPNRGQKKRAQKTGQNKQKLNSKGQKSTSRRDSPTGVRRSTRIKSRPLEYWRGERFLYGRIHDSLATVIGVKYASPCKDGSAPVLKVKSFVPEEYAPLVAQAAS